MIWRLGFHKEENLFRQPVDLQDLCAQFTEKAGVLVDLNERALQLRTGGQRDTDEEGGRYGEGGNFQGNRRYAMRRYLLVLSPR